MTSSVCVPLTDSSPHRFHLEWKHVFTTAVNGLSSGNVSLKFLFNFQKMESFPIFDWRSQKKMESFHIFEWKVKEIPDKCYHSWYYLCCDHLTRIIDWPLEENNEKSIFYILGVDSQKLQNKNWQMLHSWHYLWCCGFWDLSIWPRYWIYPGKSKNTRLNIKQ